MKELFEEIFYAEIQKYKISNEELRISYEDFFDNYYNEEYLLEKYNGKPTYKVAKEMILEYLENHVFPIKNSMRQIEKEQGQINTILRRLKRGEELNVEEMSDILKREGFKGSSTKTMYRRLIKDLMRDYYVKKTRDGYYYYEEPPAQIEINKEIQNNLLSEEEQKESFTLISNFLETIKNSPVYEKAKNYLESEKAIFHSNWKPKEENYSRVIFLGAPEANIKKEIWDLIYNAMQKQKALQIYYTAEGKKNTQMYKVHPYQLIFDNGSWELWAESITKDHNGLKLFNISRIKKAVILELGSSFFLPKNYNFLKTVSGSFGCYNDGNLQTYKIKFSKESYAWLYSKDRIWGDNQSVKETKEAFVLSFEATQFKPILRWILGWADEVEPLEPAKLVSEWKNKIKNMNNKI